MTIQVNGESRGIGDGHTVAALLRELDIRADRVAVELNLEIVPRSAYGRTPLADGDRIEIVHFIGGG